MHPALEGFNTIFNDVTNNITWQAAADVIMLFASSPNHSCFTKEADIEKPTNSQYSVLWNWKKEPSHYIDRDNLNILVLRSHHKR